MVAYRPARRRHLKTIIYVADGTDGRWEDDDRGYKAVPVCVPLSNDEIAE